MKGSGGGFHRVGVDRYAATGGDDDGIYTGTLARTGNGTEITHIGNAVEHHEERVLAFFVKEGNQLFGFLVSHRRNEGDNALVVLAGDAVDAFNRYALNGNQRAFEGCEKLLGKVALYVFFYQDLIDLFSCLYGFDNGAGTEYHFTFIIHSFSCF